MATVPAQATWIASASFAVHGKASKVKSIATFSPFASMGFNAPIQEGESAGSGVSAKPKGLSMAHRLSSHPGLSGSIYKQ